MTHEPRPDPRMATVSPPTPAIADLAAGRHAAFRAVVDSAHQHAAAHRRVARFGQVAAVLMSLGLIALLVRTTQLEMDPAPLATQAAGAHRTTSTMLARRGALLDRRGRMLAVTATATRLFVDSRLVLDPLTFPAHVGRALGIDPTWVSQQMGQRPDDRFIVLRDRLSDGEMATARELRLDGLAMQEHLVRRYPQGVLAGQVIGVVGADGRGIEGLERRFDARLTGSPGTLTLARAASRRALWLEAGDYVPVTAGQHVRLTLDIVIQSFAEDALAAACQQYAAPSGQLIVMEPQTGAILAMANYPAFDPNDLADSTAAQRRNRCVTDVFEPGSTFKTFIWAAATQLGLADLDERIDCHNGLYVTPGGRRLRDAHAFDELTWTQVLMRSSNIGMAVVGQRMGAQRMHAAVRAFGFGQSTASGLPGEVAGLVQPPARWTHYSVTSIPMGQEIAVTPLQLVRAMAIVASDGLMVTPTILQETADLAQTHPIYERVLSTANARLTRQVLRQGVTDGTGRRADSDLYAVFGKTGTAQAPDLQKGGYLDQQYVSSFLGGAPTESPAIVAGCFLHINDPSRGYYGGAVAAPVVREVIEKSLSYLGVAPDLPDADRRRVAVAP